jgi:hypothetical protein
MIINRICTVIILLFTIQRMQAQSGSAQGAKQLVSSNLKLSYNSSIIYPGLRIGTESLVKRIAVTKAKNKLIYKDRFLTSNFSFYHHPTFHTNTYLTVGYTFRRTRHKGFFTEFSPEIGYSRTFLGGTTYQVGDNGNVSVKKLAGYNYLLSSIGFGVGYDFSKKSNNHPIAMFLKPNIIVMAPYNSFLYVRPTLELGVIYKPKNFLKHSTKNIKK